MKNLFLFCLTLIFLLPTAHADLGSCLVYHTKFYLHDGRVFNACFEVMGYERECWLDEKGTNPYCNDEGVWEVFKKQQRRSEYNELNDGGKQTSANMGKLVLYKKIHYVQPQKIGGDASTKLYQFGLVLPEDVIYLDSSEVKQMIFWKAVPSPRFWLTSELIIGTPEMLERMQNHPYWNQTVVDFESIPAHQDTLVFTEGTGTMWGYQLINYSERNNVQELQRLAYLQFLPRIEKRVWAKLRRENGLKKEEPIPRKLARVGQERLEAVYQRCRLWFWKRGIVMVRLNGTC